MECFQVGMKLKSNNNREEVQSIDWLNLVKQSEVYIKVKRNNCI